MNIKALICAIASLFILAGCPSLLGQVELYIDEQKPSNPSENAWYCNPFKELKIEFFVHGAWQAQPYLCSETPRVWHGFLLISNGDDRTVVKGDGTLLIDRGLFLFAKDSIFGAYDAKDDWLVLNMAGDTLARYKVVDTGPLQWFNLAGERGACFPQYETGYPDLWDIDIHNWGILGTKGKWLIPPKFDAPFSFSHGFATVLYYGKPRTINTKGEFVD